MTGAQILDLLMSRLGGRTATDLRALLLIELNLAQSVTFEQGSFLPWFLDTMGTVTVTAGDRSSDMPVDFLREMDENPLVEILDSDGNYQPMTKGDYEEIRAHWGDDATGTLPQDYALLGNTMQLFPKPTVSTTIRIWYKASQPAIADAATETSAWLVHASDLLLGDVGVIAATTHIRDDADRAMMFQTIKDKAWARIISANTARQEVGRSRRMG